MLAAGGKTSSTPSRLLVLLSWGWLCGLLLGLLDLGLGLLIAHDVIMFIIKQKFQEKLTIYYKICSQIY